MTIQITAPHIPVTGMSSYLMGNDSCIFSAWFRAHHQDYVRIPRDFDGVGYERVHTEMVNEIVQQLEERGCEIYTGSENAFEIEGFRSGVVVSGAPDIIAVYPDGRTVIYDAKFGQEPVSHIVQVELYMYLLPKSGMERWQGVEFLGVAVYGDEDDSQRNISPDSLDEEFVSRVAEFMSMIASSEPQRVMPSLAECAGCVLTSADCSERMEPCLN